LQAGLAMLCDNLALRIDAVEYTFQYLCASFPVVPPNDDRQERFASLKKQARGLPSPTAAEAQSDESGQSNTDDLPNQPAARHHADALREHFDRALDDNVSEQVSALVNAFLTDHWQSFFHLAQEYCDGVVERAEEVLRGLALPSPSTRRAEPLPRPRARKLLLRAWKRPLRRQSGGGFGRAQKPGAPASAAANRCSVFQGLVDER